MKRKEKKKKERENEKKKREKERKNKIPSTTFFFCMMNHIEKKENDMR